MLCLLWTSTDVCSFYSTAAVPYYCNYDQFHVRQRQPFRQRRPMAVPSEIAFNPANNGEFRVPLPSAAVKFRVPPTAVNFVFSQLQ